MTLYTLQEIEASVAANGCVATGRSTWEDGEYRFRAIRAGNLYRLEATRKVPAHNASEAFRAALRPLYLARRA